MAMRPSCSAKTSPGTPWCKAAQASKVSMAGKKHQAVANSVEDQHDSRHLKITQHEKTLSPRSMMSSTGTAKAMLI